jgi:hypothetical protein
MILCSGHWFIGLRIGSQIGRAPNHDLLSDIIGLVFIAVEAKWGILELIIIYLWSLTIIGTVWKIAK